MSIKVNEYNKFCCSRIFHILQICCWRKNHNCSSTDNIRTNNIATKMPSKNDCKPTLILDHECEHEQVFTPEQLGELTPDSFMKWLNQKVFGEEEPPDNHTTHPKSWKSKVEHWKRPFPVSCQIKSCSGMSQAMLEIQQEVPKSTNSLEKLRGLETRGEGASSKVQCALQLRELHLTVRKLREVKDWMKCMTPWWPVFFCSKWSADLMIQPNFSLRTSNLTTLLFLFPSKSNQTASKMWLEECQTPFHWLFACNGPDFCLHTHGKNDDGAGNGGGGSGDNNIGSAGVAVGGGTTLRTNGHGDSGNAVTHKARQHWIAWHKLFVLDCITTWQWTTHVKSIAKKTLSHKSSMRCASTRLMELQTNFCQNCQVSTVHTPCVTVHTVCAGCSKVCDLWNIAWLCIQMISKWFWWWSIFWLHNLIWKNSSCSSQNVSPGIFLQCGKFLTWQKFVVFVHENDTWFDSMLALHFLLI